MKINKKNIVLAAAILVSANATASDSKMMPSSSFENFDAQVLELTSGVGPKATVAPIELSSDAGASSVSVSLSDGSSNPPEATAPAIVIPKKYSSPLINSENAVKETLESAKKSRELVDLGRELKKIQLQDEIADARHAANLKRIQQQAELDNAESKVAWDNERKSLVESHTKEVEKLKSSYEARIDALESKLKSAVEEEDVDPMTLLYPVRIIGIGSNMKAMIYTRGSVFQRREGEMLGDVLIDEIQPNGVLLKHEDNTHFVEMHSVEEARIQEAMAFGDYENDAGLVSSGVANNGMMTQSNNGMMAQPSFSQVPSLPDVMSFGDQEMIAVDR